MMMEWEHFDAAVKRLRDAGHTVEEMDIPGLYRINGGPEMTQRQVIQVADYPYTAGGCS